MTRPVLVLALLLRVLVAHAAEPTASVVRPEKGKRIAGLKLKSRFVSVAPGPAGPTVNLEMEFDARGRSLLRDNVPFFIPSSDTVSSRQDVSVEIPLSGKVTPITLMAVSPTGGVEEEKLRIVFDGWRADMARPVRAAASVPVTARATRLELAPRLSVFAEDAVDKANGGSATFYSTINVGGTLRVIHALGTSFETLLYGGAHREGIAPLDSGTLNKSSQLVWSAGIGAGWYPLESRRLLVTLTAGYHLQPVKRALSLTEIALDGVAVPRLGLVAAYELMRASALSLRLEVGGSYAFSGSGTGFALKNALGYSAALSGVKSLDDWQLRAAVYYQGQTAKLDVLDQTRKELGLELGVGHAF